MLNLVSGEEPLMWAPALGGQGWQGDLHRALWRLV